MKTRFLILMMATLLSFSVVIVDAAKVIVNPYIGADWSNPVKANFHTHTNNSDGSATPQAQVTAYVNKSYQILSLTDHNFNTSWTGLTTPDNFVGISGCEAGQVSNQTHLGSLFCNYTGSTTADMATRVAAIMAAGGLAIAHHPCRAIDANQATTADYANLFKNPANTNFIGLEVYSNHSSAYVSEDEWNTILTDVITTTDRNVWGFANDDCHAAGQEGYGWNMFPIASSIANEASVRNAITQGMFYFVASPGRTGTVPVIRSIAVDAVALKISIELTDNTSSSIKWYTDNGAVVKNSAGSDITTWEINCASIQNTACHFVRAVITNGTNKVYTQPFEINDVSEINSIQDLYNMRDLPNQSYVLMKNLNFNDDPDLAGGSYDDPVPAGYASKAAFKTAMTTGTGWLPIPTFAGTLYGQNYAISGLFINRDTYDVGLIATLSAKGSIQDLTINNVAINGEQGVGGFAALNQGKISLCNMTGQIEGNRFIGGIAGTNDGGTITNCAVSGNVLGNYSGTVGSYCIGGITGQNFGNVVSCLIRNCVIEASGNYAPGFYTALGGIVGMNSTGGFIKNCTSESGCEIKANDAEVSGAGGVAGVFFKIGMGGMVDCNFTGTITDNYGNSWVGGLVGAGYDTPPEASRNAYWDVQSSGISASYLGEGRMTAAMQDPSQYASTSTFVDWDFVTTYRSEDGMYPILRWTEFGGGDGTVSSPYLIANEDDLRNLQYYVGTGYENTYFALKNDIVVVNDWVPIGDPDAKFVSHFNGKGFKISGLNISTPLENHVGLFGYIGTTGVVENVQVEITSGKQIFGNVFVGGLAGYNDGVIKKCSVVGVGLIKGTSNCTGGLVGRIGFGARLSENYAHIAVKGDQYVGGLVGGVDYGSSVTTSYSKGSVTGLNPWSSGLGGLIGVNWGGTITSSYWDKQTSGRTTSAGGTGKTTAEMKQKTTYTGWNFVTVWNIVTGYYPNLR